MLCNPPFNRSREEVGRMTPEFVSEILFCDRDEQGTVEPEEVDGAGDGFDLETMFREKWEREGLPPYRIDQLWRQYLDANPKVREFLDGGRGESE